MKYNEKKPSFVVRFGFLQLIIALLYWISSQVSVVLANADQAPKQHENFFSDALSFNKKSYSALPHDTELYDILQVRPNATVTDIAKKFRRISRRYHPDKTYNETFDKTKWERIQLAHNILKKDETRLLYHKFGLIQNSIISQSQSMSNFLQLAAQGRRKTYTDPYLNQWTFEQLQLLQLMGYDPNQLDSAASDQTINRKYDSCYANVSLDERISYISSQLVETIRPLVEGTINKETFIFNVVTTMDQLKRAPLGAQILRCIGRAYRHSGQRALQKNQSPRERTFPGNPKSNIVLPLAFSLQNKWRLSKQLCVAAMASSKYLLQERKILTNKKKKGKNDRNSNPPNSELRKIQQFLKGDDDDDQLPFIDNEDILPSSTEHEYDDDEEEWDLTILQALQVEALWTLTKIDIDRIIQKACENILNEECFFNSPSMSKFHGWVGATGDIIEAHTGRILTATAIVLLGNIMVCCSKRKTSWIN